MELTCIPRDGTVLGSPGLTPVVPTAIPLSHLSLVFCQLFRLLFYAKAQSQSLCISPLPLRKQQCLCEGRESPAFSSNPDSVHHMAWSKIVVLFFINFFVPQSLIWEKKKGDGPSCGKQPGRSACSMVLHFPGYLRIWLSMLSFTSSSYTWKVETMLSSLLGSRAFFLSKNPPKQASWLCLFTWYPGYSTP